MAAGDLIYADYQYEYNGLLLGAGHDMGFAMIEVTGLGGFSAVANGTAERFGRHGAVPGQHYLNKKEFVLSFDMVVTGNSDDAFAEQIDMMYMAFAIRTNPADEIPLVMQYPGRPEKLFINCRPTDFEFPHNRDYALKNPKSHIRMEASYPVIRCLDEKQVTALYTADATGLSTPLDFPLNFGASSGANQNSLSNNGTAPAHWTAVISGTDLIDPSITEAVSGRKIFFSGLTLAAGESITLNSEKRTVMLNGTASRRHLLDKDSRWFQIPPRQQSGIIFLSENVAADARCDFYWHDTYWSI